MRCWSAIAAVFVVACSGPLADEEVSSSPVASNPLLATGTQLELAASVVFTEGPAADADGTVYFSEIRGNRILKYPADGSWSEFRKPSRRANGLAFDDQGRLIVCEGGDRQVTRTDLSTGEVEVLASKFERKRFNSPNDLVVAKNGRIYFTDPRYGDQSGRELETEDVYMVDADGGVRKVATKPEIAKPNGIALSPDQSALYVADTQPGPPSEARGMAFGGNENGSLSTGRLHYSFGQGAGSMEWRLTWRATSTGPRG